MADCIVKLECSMDEMAPAQQRVARFLLQNAVDIPDTSIDQVAAACDTSKTTVVRLCKMLGYKGYKGFCVALATDLATGAQGRISYAQVQQEDDLHATLMTTAHNAQAAISDTMRVLNEEELTAVVQAMVRAQRVDFYGVGSSGVVALDAQQKFLRVGKYTQTSMDPHAQVVLAASLAPTDVAVLFSYSGETSDMLDTLKAVRRAQALAVSVTRYGNNRLSRAADKALFVASPEGQVRISAMSSRIAMMHWVDLLFAAYTAQSYAQSKPLLDKTLLAGREKRSSQRDRSRKG